MLADVPMVNAPVGEEDPDTAQAVRDTARSRRSNN